MSLAKEFSGTIVTFVIFAALAFGVTLGYASIPKILPALQDDPEHQTDVQEAKCEMQADSIYKTSDTNDVLLPAFVGRCMTVAGYDFVGRANHLCDQNFLDAANAAQLGQPGDYSLQQDPYCYQKHPQYLF